MNKRKTESITLNFGFQHPGTDPKRIILEVNGDIIESAELDIGYVHRGLAKLFERRNYRQAITLAERVCFIDNPGTMLPYVRGVEALLGAEVPLKAKYIRTIFVELSRLASHFIWLVHANKELGQASPALWGFVDREKILGIFDYVAGARVSTAYFIPGGVRWDTQDNFCEKVKEVIDDLEKGFEKYEKIMFGSKIFKERLENVGVMKKKEALSWGVTGPALKATGVSKDVRKDTPYEIYDLLDFEPIVRNTDESDSFTRNRLRFEEMKQSMDLIRQALKTFPEEEKDHIAKLPPILKVPEGEVYSITEWSRGEIGFYIRSNGTDKPERVHIRGPSLGNLYAITKLLRGAHIADIPAIADSFDICAGDLDR